MDETSNNPSGASSGASSGRPVTRPFPTTRIQGTEAIRVDDPVAVETVVTFFANDVEVATLLCSPVNIEAMAVGFLLGEGVLSGHPGELLDAVFDPGHGIVRLKVAKSVDLSPFTGERRGTLTSGCGKGQTYAFVRDVGEMQAVAACPPLSAKAIAGRIRTFMHMSDTYRDTGGVHSAMLWDGDGLEIFCEDLGRHNAVDKVFGRCLLEGIDPAGKIMLSSGRISSEITLKCARRRVPMIVSRNAPTSFSLQLARTLDVTLVGFVRGDRMNVYTCPERVSLP